MHHRLTDITAVSIRCQYDTGKAINIAARATSSAYPAFPSHQSTELHSISGCLWLPRIRAILVRWLEFYLFCLCKLTTTISWVLHNSISNLFESHRRQSLTSRRNNKTYIMDELKMDDWQVSLKCENYVEVAGLTSPTCRAKNASCPSASLPFIGTVA